MTTYFVVSTRLSFVKFSERDRSGPEVKTVIRVSVRHDVVNKYKVFFIFIEVTLRRVVQVITGREMFRSS